MTPVREPWWSTLRKIKLPSRNRVSVAPPTATFRDLSNLNKDNRKIWKWSQLASLLHTNGAENSKKSRTSPSCVLLCWCSVRAPCSRVPGYPGTRGIRVPGGSRIPAGNKYGPERFRFRPVRVPPTGYPVLIYTGRNPTRNRRACTTRRR